MLRRINSAQMLCRHKALKTAASNRQILCYGDLWWPQKHSQTVRTSTFFWGEGGMPPDSPRVLCYKHSQLHAIHTHQSPLCAPPPTFCDPFLPIILFVSDI